MTHIFAGGWKRDAPDPRDLIYAPRKKRGVSTTNIDLRKSGLFPPIYNQGRTQSCIGASLAAVLEYGRRREKKRPDFDPSRLFIYYNTRVIEKDVEKDEGGELRNGMKSLTDYGSASEALWPFDENKVLEKPIPSAYEEGMKSMIKKYMRIPTDQKKILNVLSHDMPIAFGLSCFENFDTAKTAEDGIIPMPTGSHKGDHAMVCVGFNGTHFIVRNSWGDSWGDNGYAYIPIDYMLNDNLGGDYWCIELA